MKLNRRMFLATTASAAVLTALAACAKNGSGSSGSTAGVPTAAPDELQDGGTLRFGIATAPANWNAATVDGNVELERCDRGRQRRRRAPGHEVRRPLRRRLG